MNSRNTSSINQPTNTTNHSEPSKSCMYSRTLLALRPEDAHKQREGRVGGKRMRSRSVGNKGNGKFEAKRKAKRHQYTGQEIRSDPQDTAHRALVSCETVNCNVANNANREDVDSGYKAIHKAIHKAIQYVQTHDRQESFRSSGRDTRYERNKTMATSTSR
jgi:hypothetical protein